MKNFFQYILIIVTLSHYLLEAHQDIIIPIELHEGDVVKSIYFNQSYTSISILDDAIEVFCRQYSIPFDYCITLYNTTLKELNNESVTMLRSEIKVEVEQSIDSLLSFCINRMRNTLSKTLLTPPQFDSMQYLRQSSEVTDIYMKGILDDCGDDEKHVDDIIWSIFIQFLYDDIDHSISGTSLFNLTEYPIEDAIVTQPYKSEDIISKRKLKNNWQNYQTLIQSLFIHNRIVFIHSCSFLTSTEPSSILLKLLNDIIQSKLYNDTIMIVILNYGLSYHTHPLIADYLQQFPKIAYIHVDDDITHYEIPSIRHIHWFCQRLQNWLTQLTISHSLTNQRYETHEQYQSAKNSTDMSIYQLQLLLSSLQNLTNHKHDRAPVHEMIHSTDIITMKESIISKLFQMSSKLIQNLKKSQLLYLHTKGVSYNQESVQKTIADWADMMIYYLVYQHRKCYHLLSSDYYDTVGCNYAPYPHHTHYYSGNFWWSTTQYIAYTTKRLPRYSGKYTAEYWLLSSALTSLPPELNSSTAHDSMITMPSSINDATTTATTTTTTTTTGELSTSSPSSSSSSSSSSKYTESTTNIHIGEDVYIIDRSKDRHDNKRRAIFHTKDSTPRQQRNHPRIFVIHDANTNHFKDSYPLYRYTYPVTNQKATPTANNTVTNTPNARTSSTTATVTKSSSNDNSNSTLNNVTHTINSSQLSPYIMCKKEEIIYQIYIPQIMYDAAYTASRTFQHIAEVSHTIRNGRISTNREYSCRNVAYDPDNGYTCNHESTIGTIINDCLFNSQRIHMKQELMNSKLKQRMKIDSLRTGDKSDETISKEIQDLKENSICIGFTYYPYPPPT